MALSAGKYFSSVLAGRVFIGSTAAAGVTLPISTGTAVTFGIWNNNPGVLAVPLWYTMGYTSGTYGDGTIGFANQSVGYNINASSGFSAATLGTPKNAYLGGGAASAISFIPATATLVAGGTAIFLGGIHMDDTSVSAMGNGPGRFDFDGSIVVPPGQAFFACSSVAQAGVFSMSLAWEEIPL
jgi:hypothetical protein